MNARAILSRDQMLAAEQAAVSAGASLEALMERAGRAVADAILQDFTRRSVTVWCGPGNNGGDGYVSARLLAEAGWAVRVEALDPPVTPAAKAAAARWTGEVFSLVPGAAPADLYIDALFGAGLKRALAGPALAAARLSQAEPTVAIDLPSGLSDDLARPIGEISVKARMTVALHRRRLAHLLLPGAEACGRVVLADIGLPDDPADARQWENTSDLWLDRLNWPTAISHKHVRGRLVVISGEVWSTGAARLAARAGLRAGAGLVTLLSPRDALEVNAAHLEAIMLEPFDSPGDIEAAADDADAAVIGPAAGADPMTIANLAALERTGAAIVVDADALSAFKHDPGQLFAALDRDDVLTPHPGEFERLFPGLLKRSSSKLAAVRFAAATAGSVVLLKGYDTVVACPDGRAAVATNGSPWLATAGSGDVLAGLIGGLLSQGVESFHAACAAVWMHNQAARNHGPGLIAEDLPGLIPAVLNALYMQQVADN
ncbi:MAG: carbohydrate kinase, YjeF related protein [Caulobacteraceae bacterium]|nr:carbohydrate kinase, YjeF related protein [Caulobacteraceae bacterium]